jgi:dipeptidase E
VTSPATAEPRATDAVKIAFGGGGEPEDERPLLNVFGSWVGDRRLLYVPIAANPPYEPYLEWARESLGPSGISNIAMATSPQQVVRELERSDAIFIGGGNTYSLLHAFRTSGADRMLRRSAEGGLLVYGGSAGAILLGRDITTARHADPNEVGVTDTRGLDLALGYSIWCHYVPGDDTRIREYVREAGHGVIAISERSGLARMGERIDVVGTEPATLFGLDGSRMVEGSIPR